MADYQSTRAQGIASVDELDTWQGQPTLSSQLASVTALQTQLSAANAALTAANTANTQRQAAITAMKAAAQVDLNNDAANVAGQGVLNAAGGF